MSIAARESKKLELFAVNFRNKQLFYVVQFFFINNKKNLFKKTETSKGFSLIEGLVLLFIFSLITVTFYSLISVGTRYIVDAKNRLGAVSLADEKMEIVRNLAYANVGTVSGEVGGNIPQDEDVTENAHTYHVSTLVEYVDD